MWSPTCSRRADVSGESPAWLVTDVLTWYLHIADRATESSSRTAVECRFYRWTSRVLDALGWFVGTTS